MILRARWSNLATVCAAATIASLAVLHDAPATCHARHLQQMFHMPHPHNVEAHKHGPIKLDKFGRMDHPLLRPSDKKNAGTISLAPPKTRAPPKNATKLGKDGKPLATAAPTTKALSEDEQLKLDVEKGKAAHLTKMQKLLKEHNKQFKLTGERKPCSGRGGEVHGGHCVCHDGYKCAGTKCSKGMTKDGRWFSGWHLFKCEHCHCIVGDAGLSKHKTFDEAHAEAKAKHFNQKNQKNPVANSHQSHQPAYNAASAFQAPAANHANAAVGAVGAAAGHKVGSIEHVMEQHSLGAYTHHFKKEGYDVAADLKDADESEITSLVAAAKMKKPQERRFRKLLKGL